MSSLPIGSKIHLIAVGGSAMHNLAIALKENGMVVTGSDDEIYEPALSRLKKHEICPNNFGWFVENIDPTIDAVILGMHAKKDNPELIKAMELGLKIYSYPEFIYHQSQDKIRIVIAGSHGKTSTTAMILHVLKELNMDFDYLVGAQLEGFDTMVKLSEAPIIIIEGDEYLSSPIDRIPKIHHYHPHLSIITGIAWDHINVFPTFENYKEQFKIFLELHEKDANVIYYSEDQSIQEIIRSTHRSDIKWIPYRGLSINKDRNIVMQDQVFEYHLIGQHNLQNANAALLACEYLNVDFSTFLSKLNNFTGASKRLQWLAKTENGAVFLDFAHAPSKVKATTEAVKEWFENRKLIAILELHTFSSLNEDFIPQYKNTLAAADQAIVYFDAHTLEMKGMPKLSREFVEKAFAHNNILVFDNRPEFHAFLSDISKNDVTLLLMTSGNFGGYDIKTNFV